MQYGIMKYNTLQHGADRAGRARGWACRGRRQGQANKAGRGSASAASQTSSRRQDLAPASSSGGTHDRRARMRQTATRDPCLLASPWARSQETSAPCPECGGCWREVLVLVSVLSHDASAEQQWPPVSLYRRKLSPLFIIPTQQASCRHSDGTCERPAFEDSFLYMICRSAPYWGLIIIFIFIILKFKLFFLAASL